MQTVCIKRNVIGEDFDLCVKNGAFSWTEQPPEGCWIFGDPDSSLSLELLAKLSNMTIRNVPIRFRDAFGALHHQGPIKWRYALPKVEFKGLMGGMLEDIESLLNTGCVGYYTEVFRRTREGLGALERAKVDIGRLGSYINSEPNETNRAALATLRPESDGFTQRVIYNQVSTVTGRLIIEKGPRVLTLPRRYKDALTSRYPGGHIVSIDYSSLEPRAILVAQGRPAPRDVYDEVCEKIFAGKLTRHQAKGVTIPLLYGAQEALIGKLSGLSDGALREAIQGVSKFFTLDAFNNRLLHEAKATSGIKNYYGRPIVLGDRHNLSNLYAQSTAVDMALLGFSQAIAFIKDAGLRVHPLFVIHDALILDVHPDEWRYISDIVKQCEKVPGVEAEFPVHYEEIRHG